MQSGLPAISDDSGLCVDAIDGEPGVYSARYAGEEHDSLKNMNLLLENMKSIDKPTEKSFHPLPHSHYKRIMIQSQTHFEFLRNS